MHVNIIHFVLLDGYGLAPETIEAISCYHFCEHNRKKSVGLIFPFTVSFVSGLLHCVNILSSITCLRLQILTKKACACGRLLPGVMH